MCAAHSRADKVKLRQRLQQEGKSPEESSHAWFQFLHLQLTDEDYSVRKASTFCPADSTSGNAVNALQAWVSCRENLLNTSYLISLVWLEQNLDLV